MAGSRLDSLPQELIAQIAISNDAYTALQMTLTCRRIRAACYDALVFKDILERSQRYQWRKNSLDISAIEHRCGKDVRSWIRYAIANELTIRYAQEQQSTLAPEKELTSERSTVSNMPWSCLAPQIRANGSKEIAMLWLPELFLVKHPFMLDGFWRVYLDIPPAKLMAKHVFCLTMAVLAVSGQMLGLERALEVTRGERLLNGDAMSDFLWTLCWTILHIRGQVTSQLAAWPYNDAARVPYLQPPGSAEVSLQPLTATYEIPLPLNNDFEGWYHSHTEAMATEKCFTGGRWQGYYCHFGTFSHAARRLDPPMTGIRFARDQESGAFSESLRIKADNCLDGVDHFTLRGSITARDTAQVFRGTKRYTHGTRWDWNLRVTPFGLVGHWGTLRGERFDRLGSIWLWKVNK